MNMPKIPRRKPRRPDDNSPQRTGVPTVWGRKVPLQNPNFIGRTKILGELRKGLTSQANPILLYALQGLAGIGKTQIAAEYAHQHKTDYDIVWWIPADQPWLIGSSIAGLAPYLNLGGSLSVDVAAPIVLDSLRRGDPYSRWLLIFDNADQPESLKEFLLDGPGHTIVTSRNPEWGTIVKPIEVDVFERDESRAFLRRRVPGVSITECDQLADALGDLPLALEQAVALQSRTAMPVNEYLDALEEDSKRLLSQFKPTEYPLSVAATWAVSVATLKDEQSDAVTLLRVCAFFGPDPIPRDVLSQGRSAVRAELGAILRDPISLNEAIGGLARYSLAQINRANRTVQVHRVVQALVRQELSPEEAQQFSQDVHSLLVAATPSDPDDSSTWRRFDSLRGHYEPAGIVSSHDSTTRLMVRGVIRYYYMIGNYDAALELGERALAEWSSDPNTQVTDLLAIKRHLGNILRALGRYSEAFTVNSEAMGEAGEKLGLDHDETLRVTNSHGADLRALGQFKAAYALDEESVERHKHVFGDADRRTLRAQNNFGLECQLAGRYTEARKLHETVYQAGPAVYGRDDHPSVLITLNNLARAIRLSGKYTEARALSEDVYSSCVNALGELHPITLHAMKDLAIARRLMLGGSDDAVQVAAAVLGNYERIRNETHPRTLAAQIALSNVLREARDIIRAIETVESALSKFPNVYGGDHPYTYACKGNMALLKRLNGEPEEALALHQAAVAGLERSLGADHCYTLVCAVGLASDLAALGDAKGARERGEDAMAGLTGVLGEDHPITLACAVNVASDLTELQFPERAEQLREDALRRYRVTLGPQHPTVQAAVAGHRLDCDFDPA